MEEAWSSWVSIQGHSVSLISSEPAQIQLKFLPSQLDFLSRISLQVPSSSDSCGSAGLLFVMEQREGGMEGVGSWDGLEVSCWAWLFPSPATLFQANLTLQLLRRLP